MSDGSHSPLLGAFEQPRGQVVLCILQFRRGGTRSLEAYRRSCTVPYRLIRGRLSGGVQARRVLIALRDPYLMHTSAARTEFT